MTDSARWVQPFRTNCDAVHDASAPENAEWIFESGQTFRCRRIATVGKKAVCLQQPCGTDKFVRVPPKRRATRGTAGAKDALVEAVEFGTIFRTLQALNVRHRLTIH